MRQLARHLSTSPTVVTSHAAGPIAVLSVDDGKANAFTQPMVEQLNSALDDCTDAGADMAEHEFITAVLERADCDLLLDVNNVFVNSINAGYDPVAFLDRLPLERVRYLHVAGHWTEDDNLRIDTHGAPVCDEVFALLDAVYARLGPVPTLLERDFNIPPWPELHAEMMAVEARRRAVLPEAAKLAR